MAKRGKGNKGRGNKDRKGKRSAGSRPSSSKADATAASSVPAAASAAPDTAPPAPDDVVGRAIPAGPWTLPVILGVVLCALLSAGAELGWREHGLRPTVDHGDPDLWAAERKRASTGADDVIVVIGKSRSLLDIHGPTLQARFPDREVIQLALKGKGAFAAFEDLVHDEDFKGRILFGLSERDLHLDNADDQQPFVQAARRAGPVAVWDARLRAAVASRLALRSYLLAPQFLLENIATGKLPPPTFVVTGKDRFTHADFSRADLRVVAGDVIGRQRRVLQLLGDRQTPSYPWVIHVMRVEPLIKELRARGGDVAFVHLPVSGESRVASERLYPKARFWDAFARTVGPRAVHFRDVPSLEGYTCPDTSHLDEKDTPRFTEALALELERRGLFPLAGDARGRDAERAAPRARRP